MFLRKSFPMMATLRVDTKGYRWQAPLLALALACTLALKVGIGAPCALAAA